MLIADVFGPFFVKTLFYVWYTFRIRHFLAFVDFYVFCPHLLCLYVMGLRMNSLVMTKGLVLFKDKLV